MSTIHRPLPGKKFDHSRPGGADKILDQTEDKGGSAHVLVLRFLFIQRALIFLQLLPQ